MNNRAIFSIQHSSENTALRMENTGHVHTILNLKKYQNKLFVNQKCLKLVKALPSSFNMKKIALWVSLKPNTALGLNCEVIIAKHLSVRQVI